MFVVLSLLLLCSLGCSRANDNDYNPVVIKVTLEILRVISVNHLTPCFTGFKQCCEGCMPFSYNIVVSRFDFVLLVDSNKTTEEGEFDCVLHLIWNPWILNNAGNILPSLSLVWRPDIISYQSSQAVFSDSNVTYGSQFDATWSLRLRTRVPCEIMWPRKDFKCQISFTSQSHDQYAMRLEGTHYFLRYPDDATSLADSGYRVWSAGLTRSSRTDPCCDRPVDVITFPINLSK